ncbi:ribosome recycling factor [Wolbachia pipientis]|uniref:Ribosome-recycling factor n=1 Tax=Wolbachia pipientis TaxID=955 RepID=A0A1E7QJV7_WOLPI|nr:ribosome recycling factor [Wolbachia pipientis]OEY86760.1 ribosome recycling factor [Wolbachia pipientis]
MLEIKNEMKENISKTIQVFHNDIKGVRTGRASASLLDGVVVNVYGGHQKLNEVANVSSTDNKTLLIKIYDMGNIGEVKNAILNTSLSLNPIVEGSTIRIVLPELTQETREKYVKLLHQYAEKARIAIRKIRENTIKKLKKMKENKEISEDDFHNIKEEIQNITDNNIKTVDNELSLKEKDILQH